MPASIHVSQFGSPRRRGDDSLFEQHDHLAPVVDGAGQLQQFGVIQLVHDGNLLAHLGAVGSLDTLDELGGEPVTRTALYHLRAEAMSGGYRI